MAAVIGIDAYSIYSNDPDSLAKWYSTRLGLALDYEKEGGFYHTAFTHPTAGTVMRFSILRADEKLEVGARASMVNFQVDDFDAFLQRLRDLGAQIDNVEEYDYGRFAHIQDPEGNKIELWSEKM